MRVRAVLIPGLLFALSGCSEDTLGRVESALVARPEAVDFGEGCIGVENRQVLELSNIGRAAAIIAAARIEPPTAPFSAAPPAEPLPPGGRVELEVFFAPEVPRERSAAALVLEAEDGASLEVALEGVAGIRELEVFPARVDFGVVDEGTPTTRAIELRNVGGSPLNVSEVVWTSTSTDLRPAAEAFRGGVVPAKSVETFDVVYDPQDLGGDRGLVVIFSDDPSSPRIEVPIVAKANLRPRVRLAACREEAPEGRGCAPGEGRAAVTAGLEQTIFLDARDAMDPEGATLTYRWPAPQRPEGSIASVLPGGDASTGDIFVDRLGAYVVSVEVRDERGLSSLPAEVRIDPRDLEVRLVWDVATDVDLHLVRPGGRVGDYGSGVPGRSVGSDCSPFNRAPRWGDPDESFDDPRLDRDAVSSPGPELAGLDRPEAGDYRVFAHYCDSRGNRVRTAARLEVRSRGRVVAELGPVELRPGDLWPAAALSWDDSAELLEARALRAPIENRPDVCRTNP